MKKLVLLFLFMATLSFSQGYKDSNRIGIGGGISQMTLYTSNIKVSQATGWSGGFHLRGNYYNNWQMSFGMNFTDSKFKVATKTPTGLARQTEYTMSGVQIYLLPGYVLSKNHFNLEFGQVIQINDKLKLKDEEENYTIDGLSGVKAKDITDVTKLNINIYAGINVGITNLRARIGYQQGLTNFFGNLNDNSDVPDIGEKWNARMGMITANLTIYL